MKFGVQVNCYGTTWDDIRASIETMEAGSWDSLWFADHFFPPWHGSEGHPSTEHRTAFEGYTLIAVAAGMTEKLRLGHLVLGNTYRNPGLLAKMATTLDQASKGRFTLSLGAAWFKREHEAYGWESRNLPDGMSVESYRHKIGVLERHCEDVGRDPAEIKSTMHMPLNLTDDKESARRFIETLGPGTMAGPRNYIVDRIGEFADAGVEEIIFPPFRDAETAQRVDEEIVASEAGSEIVEERQVVKPPTNLGLTRTSTSH